MGFIVSLEELMNHIANMYRDNSPLVLQEEDGKSVNSYVERNPQLKQMIKESRSEYKKGVGMSTSDLLNSLSVKDFE